jgi:hypothetical protein
MGTSPPNLFSFRQFEHIALEIDAMSAVIRKARDMVPGDYLASRAEGDDGRPAGAAAAE